MALALVLIGIIWVCCKLAKESYDRNQTPFHNDPVGRAHHNAFQDEMNRQARANGCSEEFIKEFTHKY